MAYLVSYKQTRKTTSFGRAKTTSAVQGSEIDSHYYVISMDITFSADVLTSFAFLDLCRVRTQGSILWVGLTCVLGFAIIALYRFCGITDLPTNSTTVLPLVVLEKPMFQSSHTAF